MKGWRTRGTALLSGSRVVYTPISLLFLAYLFIAEQEHIYASLSGLTPIAAAEIFLLISAGHIFIAVSSHLLFLSCGQTPTLELVIVTHINRLPARYLPGGVWQTISRALDFSAQGLPPQAILHVVALEVGLAVCLTAMIGGLLLGFSGTTTHPASMRLLALLGMLGIVVLPYLIGAFSKGSTQLRIPQYAASAGAFAVVCLLYGGAFYLFVGQLLPSATLGQASGVFLVSWLAGFIAFFAPQGIGVFEATAGYLLTGHLAVGFVASMFAFRAMSILSDLALWFFFRVWRWALSPRSGARGS